MPCHVHFKKELFAVCQAMHFFSLGIEAFVVYYQAVEALFSIFDVAIFPMDSVSLPTKMESTIVTSRSILESGLSHFDCWNIPSKTPVEDTLLHQEARTKERA